MPSERNYAERLREQAYKTLAPQISNLEVELRELSNSLSNGIYKLERKLEAVSQVELPTTEVVLAEIMEDVLRQKNSDEQSLARFAQNICRKETQEEILGMLLDYAGLFFPKVALFAIRNNRFVGWSSRGYNEETARTFSGFSIERSECTPFQEALELGEITPASDLSDNNALTLLKTESTGSGFLVPMHVLQRPAALLYAESEGESTHTHFLSILADLTALRLENIALQILYALTGDKAVPAHEVEPAPSPFAESMADSFPDYEEDEAARMDDRLEEENVPAPETEPEEAALPPASDTDMQIPDEQESFTEQVSDTDEPVAAEENREMPVEDNPLKDLLEEEVQVDEMPQEAQADETPQEPEPQESEVEHAESETTPEANEEALHADAKRFARLLVSEIKLYNESPVVEGRKNQDLYLRLKRDIDKSREMYSNRVAPIVARKNDYFHDEIIRILGDNDPSTLGSDYPGPIYPE